jgi:hypothetical protein
MRSIVGLAASLLLAASTGFGQKVRKTASGESGTRAPMALHQSEAVRAFPTVAIGDRRELKYVGSYCFDGKFRAVSRRDRLFPDRTLCGMTEARSPNGARQSGVLSSGQLSSSERLVDDFEPPAHAVVGARGHSVMAKGRGAMLTFLYGRERILRVARYLSSDSNQRLIISDPALPAIHVLDSKGRASFRIVGGQDRRLRSPSGVAVDGENNIYVADAERGIVFVYGPDGVFLRSIGDLGGGEGLFRHPTGVAIDRRTGRLYVLDNPRLLMLDLQGRILKRIGRLRGDTGELSNPKDIALGAEELLVLDMDGRRVQIMDLECNLLRRISLSDVPMSQDLGIGVDHDGDIYVSFADASVVKVYNYEGALLNSFGGLGFRVGEFNFPTGLWLDSRNRLYVADTRNARVQVFQLSTRNVETEKAIGSQ